MRSAQQLKSHIYSSKSCQKTQNRAIKVAFLYPKPAQNRRNPPFFANFMVRAGRISQILPKSNQIGTNTQSHRFQALDHKKNKNFLLFNHQHSIPSPPNFYPNKYKHTNYMTMTIIQNQRERAKLF